MTASEGDLTKVDSHLQMGRVPKICLEICFDELETLFSHRKNVKWRERFSGNSLKVYLTHT